MNKSELKRKGEELLRMARNSGVETDYLFATTFARYQFQLQMLDRLEKLINEEDILITKEYVRGSKNLCINPAVSEYNRTCTAANGTVQSLLKIISTLSKDGLKGSNNADDDPFK